LSSVVARSRCPVHDHKYFGLGQSTLRLLTGAGPTVARIRVDSAGLAESVAVDLGRPVLAEVVQRLTVDGTEFETHDVSMGNPHCIVLLQSSSVGRVNHAASLAEFDVDAFGRALHDQSRYAPTNGANVSFVTIRDSMAPPAVDIRTYERGAGETWSCGSGITATVCSLLARRRRTNSSAVVGADGSYSECVRVFVRGGELTVTCRLADRAADDSTAVASAILHRDVLSVELDGPATEVFQGSCSIRFDPHVTQATPVTSASEV
jgi:diaminopimelate epimerase